MNNGKNKTASLKTSWFDEKAEDFFSFDDFIEFQKISDVDFNDLISDNPITVRTAQHKLARQSIVYNEIQKLHFGFGFPFLVYTHDFNFFEKVQSHNTELDKLALASDMGDSLRRRHIALSYAIIPEVINELSSKLSRPLIIKNLGSGVGLDTINSLVQTNGKVAEVLNYDTNKEAIDLGLAITEHLEQEGSLNPGTNKYFHKSLTESIEPADVIIKIGIICGMEDRFAKILLHKSYKSLNPGGTLIVSSSNQYMMNADPLGSFLIQHIGSGENPYGGWGLNFRTEESLKKLLNEAGFSDVNIYDDSNYPGKESLKEAVLNSVDTLPSTVMDYEHSGKPFSLPPAETLDKCNGYNWIAVCNKQN